MTRSLIFVWRVYLPDHVNELRQPLTQCDLESFLSSQGRPGTLFIKHFPSQFKGDWYVILLSFKSCVALPCANMVTILQSRMELQWNECLSNLNCDGKVVNEMGPWAISIFDKTSYRKFLKSLKSTRLGIQMLIPLYNLTETAAKLLQIKWKQRRIPISRLDEVLRFEVLCDDEKAPCAHIMVNSLKIVSKLWSMG